MLETRRSQASRLSR